MFVNSNYSAKLSPTMKENWLVQIFKNTKAKANYQTNDANVDLKFCIAPASNSTTFTFNSLEYIPAILNKPSIGYSLDISRFTSKTSGITLNVSNVNVDGTPLLEQLGNEYINGQVNVLSVIDDDSSAGNALQIFSGKISSFTYKNNVIIFNIISTRPLQDVELPNTKTTGDFAGKTIPYVLG